MQNNRWQPMTCAVSCFLIWFKEMCVDWIKYDINKFQWWRGWKWIKHEAVFLSFVLFSVTELGLRCLAVIHTSICAILNYVRTAGWQQTLQITGSTRGFTCADVKAGIWKCCILHCGVVNEKGVDLFIRILIRGAACCDSTEGCKVNINAANFSHPNSQLFTSMHRCKLREDEACN